MVNKTFIYSLSDSNGNLRYVGKTNNPEYRLRKHLNESKNKRTHKEKWINSILISGDNIILDILDVVDNKEWSFWEIYWINQIKAWGFELVNGTSGGEGSDGFRNKKHNNETKLKCSIAISKRKTTAIMSGEKNGRCKLSDFQVTEIKEKVLLGIDKAKIANEYLINKKYINQIINGKRRKQ
jgi:hypothetical protein